jgi:DNA-directed RNA polymerase subunit RPC12/RpoP
MFGKKCVLCGTRVGGLFGVMNYGNLNRPLCWECDQKIKPKTTTNNQPYPSKQRVDLGSQNEMKEKKEYIKCPKCGELAGKWDKEILCEPPRYDGTEGDKTSYSQFKCIKCRNTWLPRYDEEIKRSESKGQN